ncbi:MAG: HD domain-containing protein [Proteobacteria bacterium]|nr:HD domain-containing protein [Pseudomonadota bacterium]
MSDEKMYEIVNDPKKLKKYKPFKVYSIVDNQYVMAKPPNEDFDDYALNSGKQKNRLFISLADRVRLIQEQQFRLHQDLKKSLKVDIPKSREIIKNMVNVTMAEPRGKTLRLMQKTINLIVNEYLENPSVVIQLTYVSVHDYSTQLHLTNAMLLCIGYASHHQFSIEKIKLFGLMGLMHDVGKVEIPDYLLQAPRKLTSEEFDKIKKHPAASMKMLRDDNFSEEIQRVALEHHERIDGSGYPFGKRGGELSGPSKVLAIIDIFEALTTWRPYKESYPPIEALKIIKEEVDAGKLDRDIFEKFAYSIIGMTRAQ